LSTRAATLLLTGLLLAYAAWLSPFVSTAAGGSDSSGYLNLTAMFLEGRVHRPAPGLARLLPPGRDWRHRDRELVFVPLGFVRAPERGQMAPYYPPGVPALMALLGLLLGPGGPFLLGPIAAALGVWLTQRLGIEAGLDRWTALAPAAVLALHPVYLRMALEPLSDVVATVLTTGAVALALAARRGPARAAPAGALFVAALAVRPANFLVLPALVVVLAPELRLGIRFLLGALPGALLLAAYQWAVYGHPLRTGYGDVGPLLALGHFPDRFAFYTASLSRTLTFLVPLAALALPFLPAAAARVRAALLVWFLAYLLFYCCYRPYEIWTYLRFLLPALPALLVAATLALRHAFRATARWLERLGHPPAFAAFAAGILLMAVLAKEQAHSEHRQVFDVAREEAIYPRMSRLAASLLAPGAPVLGRDFSGALLHYTDLAPLRYDGLDPARAEDLSRHALGLGLELHALVWSAERKELEAKAPGDWRLLARDGEVELLRLAPPAPGAVSALK
jgi:hypothetical protein